MSKRIDITGLKFNRLLVLGYAYTTQKRATMWNCLCDCGNIKAINSNSLRKGRIKSCGCLQKEVVSSRKLPHRNSYLYRIWASIKSRCNNDNSNNYGSRGISYDESWESFDIFYNDMSSSYIDGYEIDRIDVNGNYSKDNCRWISKSENNFNKRLQSNNLTGKSGVSWSKLLEKYRCYINSEGVRIELGYFETFEEALEVREKAEIKYYGYNRP